jgi:hypothetical protein
LCLAARWKKAVCATIGCLTGRQAPQARSTKNLFPAGFAGKNILSVSPRLLKTF